MSEDMNQDIVDVVKSSVDGAIEAKADKAEVAELKSALEAIEVPSVEGFVKSEALEALEVKFAEEKSAREELEAIVKAAPAIIKGDNMTAIEFSYEKGGDIDLSAEFVKSYDVQANVAGAPTGAAAVYHAMVQMNPWRSVSTVMPSTATAC